MKSLIISILYVSLFLSSSVYLYADDGITLYSEDFSSAPCPSWMTNNSADYYWDSTGGRYHYKIIDATNEYAYVPVHLMDASFRSFKLTFDLLPTYTGWAGDFRLGVSDSNMSYIAPTSIVGSFYVGDGGHFIWLCGTDNLGRYFSNWSSPESFTDGVLYQLTLSRDNLTLYTDLLVIKKETGDTVYAATIYGYGPFLGMDRIYMGSIGDPGYPGCYAEGYIDNVVLTVKPYNGDVNCDNKTSVGDVVYLINYLFKGGPPPCQ
ncbi:MAG: hypothetical protein MUP17_05180 [candidate division Zixibacteria bacterium]|nr:hypothetical protein [candidate division Zixibacteria bacterium]